jgi:phosphate transport system protein
MELRVEKEIAHIRELVIHMATLTEEAVVNAIESFLKLDVEMAQTVINNDSEINSLEMDVDKETFECLALKAPVAKDLRFLFCIQKINKDLERIGDHAVNIAQAALNCNSLGRPVAGPDIKLMSSVTRGMLSDAINCFIKTDTQLALKVLERDDQVDELNRSMSREVINMVKKDVASVEACLELLRVSKNLERIADLSTNISEDVIFHANAKDVKHHH